MTMMTPRDLEIEAIIASGRILSSKAGRLLRVTRFDGFVQVDEPHDCHICGESIQTGKWAVRIGVAIPNSPTTYLIYIHANWDEQLCDEFELARRFCHSVESPKSQGRRRK